MALIREMDISDYSQVIELWSETEAMLLRDADSRENIGKYLERNPNLSFVAVDGGTIVGAILVGTDGRRGKGIGAKLISSAVDALSNIGIAKTHLFVANENLNAQYFYEKLGWFPRDEVRMFSFNSSCSGNV
ncbi:GNAT family N-acetyltransferase [Vibrio harveyi]|uniref:GNAT family N-acetyltransferase n=1 Tax=Vibrio harveyi TaxID=669 RepID=UPI0021A71898|nr:GNAT family N-acetyltransferase [Vibrio harveyi]HDM8062579.1 GNAT family N-acetyltransferase [Vibrio harveyi]